MLAIAALVAASCTQAAVTGPATDCPPVGEPEWCHYLDNDVVIDTLIPLPGAP